MRTLTRHSCCSGY